jgi:hypothetical protein
MEPLDDVRCTACGAWNRPGVHYVEVVTDGRGAWLVCVVCDVSRRLKGRHDAPGAKAS